MSTVEKLVNNTSKSQKELQKQALLQEERELRKKLAQIETYPGSLEEFNQLTEKQHELIALPGEQKFLEGGFLEWKQIDLQNPDQVKKAFFKVPLTKLKIGVALEKRSFYSEIKAQAVKLNANALIYYRKDSYSGSEIGVPVRQVLPFVK